MAGTSSGHDAAGESQTGFVGAIDAVPAAPHHPAMSRPRPRFEITPDVLLRAYSIGLFPMAESREAETLFWVEPEARGVFPLDGLIVSRSLAKTTRGDAFEVVADRAFDAVMAACADRDKTWINADIRRLYGALFDSVAPIRSRPIKAASWLAVSTASALARRFSARACSIVRATPPRWR